FVLASRWEGMPNAVLEAMAAGVPVVATDVEGIRELIDDGVHGLVVPAGDAASLAAGLNRLLKDPAAARTLASNAQAKVSQEFTWGGAARRFALLYESLCD